VASGRWAELPAGGGGNAPCARAEVGCAPLPGGGAILYGGFTKGVMLTTSTYVAVRA